MPKTPWTGEAETILKREHGRRSAAEIVTIIQRETGARYSEKTILRYQSALNLVAYRPERRNWTRREQLLSRKSTLYLSAAGLDVAHEFSFDDDDDLNGIIDIPKGTRS